MQRARPDGFLIEEESLRRALERDRLGFGGRWKRRKRCVLWRRGVGQRIEIGGLDAGDCWFGDGGLRGAEKA